MSQIPEGTTHKWTGIINPPNNVRIYYKFVDEKWWSYSNIFNCWLPSRNDDSWFTNVIIQGYFKEING